MPTIPPGLFKSKKQESNLLLFLLPWGGGDAAKTLRLDYSCASRMRMLIYYEQCKYTVNKVLTYPVGTTIIFATKERRALWAQNTVLWG